MDVYLTHLRHMIYLLHSRNWHGSSASTGYDPVRHCNQNFDQRIIWEPLRFVTMIIRKQSIFMLEISCVN